MVTIFRLSVHKLRCVRNEWKSLMKEEAAEPSSTVPAPLPGNSISSTTIKQPDDDTFDDHDEEIEALLSDPKHESPRSSCKAKTPAPVEQSPKKRKGKKVAANTSKTLKTRTEEQSDDNEENDEAVSSRKKRRKTDNDDAKPEREDTNSNSFRKTALKRDDGHTLVKPYIDSYRPSYEDNRIRYESNGSVIRPNPRHNTQYFQNARQGPKIPEVLDTRQQPESGARTPYHGGRETHPPRTPGRQNIELSPPQHNPQGPKNPQNQYNHSKQAGGARCRAWSPANRSSQNSGSKTPGWNQASRAYEDAGSNTPGQSQNHRPTSAPRGRTPGYFVDNESSHSWKHGKSHFNSQQRRNENNQNPNNQRQPSSKPTFTGGTHHRFKDEQDTALFVSP
ncbi:hypothetical protein EPUS_03808 [Endocarpon pusillum Z07020]|uniref:Uncharacterized protein n=1 Tax=Endocarpon pusillum (strain Z07020 / HMAS-L-300199) TaxID=1263415 RepID=U1HX43_ENDPU|nr:uncharacterized protein EPUS_03808 [Endocarpon pusillum Z07020]ERF73994.1 hypothetical protein EPUS_03808 [Endocarpon pusillum Z07020]